MEENSGLRITRFKTSPTPSRHLLGLTNSTERMMQIPDPRGCADLQRGLGAGSTFDICGSGLESLAKERFFLTIVRNMNYPESLL